MSDPSIGPAPGDVSPELLAAIEQLREVAITITLDGEPQPTYRPADVSPAQASALRVQSHGAWRVPTLHLAMFEADAEGNVGTLIGPEEIAGVVFLGRRQAGETVTYDAVCQRIAEAKVTIVDFGGGDDDDEVIDDPPA